MTFDELRTLQPEDFFRWPLRTRLIISGIFVAILGLLFYFFFLQPLNEQLNTLREEEQSLKTQLRNKQRLAANLPRYQAQLEEIQRRFDLMVRQLPSRAEIPSLLDDVTVAGRSRGLDFQLFQPLPEQVRDYDAEVPVKITVQGGYDAMGNFAAAVAALPRIVTLHDINLLRAGGQPAAGASASFASKAPLRLEARLQTYRYLDEAELNAKAKAEEVKK